MGDLVGDEGFEEAIASNVKASRDLVHAVQNEIALAEGWIEDFAESELEMKGVHDLMERCIPEAGASKGEKPVTVVASPESLIAVTKAAELFILDLALNCLLYTSPSPRD